MSKELPVYWEVNVGDYDGFDSFVWDQEWDKKDDGAVYGWKLLAYTYIKHEAKELGLDIDFKTITDFDDLVDEDATPELLAFAIGVISEIANVCIDEDMKDIKDVIEQTDLTLTKPFTKSELSKLKIWKRCEYFITD